MPRRDLVLLTFSLLVFGIMSYLLAVDVFRFTGFMGPDSGARLAMIHNWIDHGNPVFLNAREHSGAAITTDGLAGYTVQLNRGTCTVYPPAFPMASTVFFVLLGPPGLVVLPILGGLLTVLFSTLAAREWGLRGAWVAPVMVVATPLALYASNFWDHSIQMAIAAFALWMLARAERVGSLRAALVAGIALGAGGFVHETLVLAGISLALAGWAPKPAFWVRRFTLGFVLAVGAWLLSNQLIYGSLRGPHTQGPLDLLHPAKVHALYDVAGITFRLTDEVSGGRGVLDLVLVMLWLSMVLVGVLRGVRWTAWMFLAGGAIATHLFFDLHFALGLFQTTPWLLMAFADPMDRGIGATKSSPLHTRFVIACTLFLLLAAITPVSPGMNWGSRYMLTAMPWMAVLAVRSCTRWLEGSGGRARTRALLMMAPVAMGAFALGRGAHAYVLKLEYDRVHADALLSAPPHENVATDMWWLPPELEGTVPSPRYYLTSYVPGSGQLATPTGDTNATIRAAFLDQLDQNGVQSFTFIGSVDGLVRLRELAAHRQRVFMQTSEKPAAELIIGQFSRVDSISANGKQP